MNKSKREAPWRQVTYVGLLAGTLLLGLVVRSHGMPLPGWFTKSAGDVLYAVAAYWGWRLVWPRGVERWVWAVTCVSCAGIEFLKLCDEPWLVSARASQVGRVIFGVGFHWGNLVCYLVGAGLAVGVERAWALAKGRAG
ncbi:hypothetical protein BH09VER1_BH09VER1_36620 [soil metagenome]